MQTDLVKNLRSRLEISMSIEYTRINRSGCVLSILMVVIAVRWCWMCTDAEKDDGGCWMCTDL